MPPPAPVPAPVESISRPRGRRAVSAFANNIVNIDPTNYMWVKNNSNYTLCHKESAHTQPTRALLWIVGDVDSHSLSNAESYDSWTANIRLSPPTNAALNALLKTGPFKTYTTPARYSILRVKATLKTVLEDLRPAEGGDDFAAPGEPISIYDVYPFIYDGSMLTEKGSVPNSGYDVNHFTDQTTVGVEVSFLAYHMDGREPGFSVSMQGVYHLGTLSSDTPSTPGKRKGGCIISPRRQRDAPFAADPSKTT
jgi:hypothetical protein